MQRQTKHRQGFTLIEILVGIAIVSIMSTIGYRTVNGVIDYTQQSKVLQEVNKLNKVHQAFVASGGATFTDKMPLATNDNEQLTVTVAAFSEIANPSSTLYNLNLTNSPQGNFINNDTGGNTATQGTYRIKYDQATSQFQLMKKTDVGTGIVLAPIANASINFQGTLQSLSANFGVDVSRFQNLGMAYRIDDKWVWNYQLVGDTNYSQGGLAQSGQPPGGPNPLPTVSLTPNPTSVYVGQAVNFTWLSNNAGAVVSNTVPGADQTVLNGAQSVVFNTAATYTYSITVSGIGTSASATATASAQVTVNALNSLPTVTLTPSVTTVEVGNPITFTWTSTNASSVISNTVPGADQTLLNGSSSPTFNSAGTFTYSITVAGIGSSASATATASATITITAAGEVIPPGGNPGGPGPGPDPGPGPQPPNLNLYIPTVQDGN